MYGSAEQPNLDLRRDSNAIHVLHAEVNMDGSSKLTSEDTYCTKSLNHTKKDYKATLNCFNICSQLQKRFSKTKAPTHLKPSIKETNYNTQQKDCSSEATASKLNHTSPNGMLQKFIRFGASFRAKEYNGMQQQQQQQQQQDDQQNNIALNKIESTPTCVSPVIDLKCSSHESAECTIQLSAKIDQNNDHQLDSIVERCEKRLERLYNRLIWLRNTTDSNPIRLAPMLKEKQGQQITAAAAVSSGGGDDDDDYDDHDNVSSRKNYEELDEAHMCTVERKMVHISEKLHNLKCQVDTYSYLSWLGFVQVPQSGKVAVPSQNAPPPNPQLHLIRRPDSDVRLTIEEYKRLCNHPISEKVRMELRGTTFNNWPWGNAWLIRFVRQMFVDLNFVQHFQLQFSVLDRWLCDVYRRYNRVPFHNYKHAFMVTQMCYAIIWNAKLTEALEMEEQMILIVSAICHDLDHPGFNNAYQINAGTALALRYNDQSPLENHHAAMAFDILGHKEVNPFNHLDPETYRRIREGIIRCILATDMSRHNEILEQFTSKVLESRASNDSDCKKPSWALDKSKRDLVMMIILKVSDISNEARPLHVAGPWINRLLAEFFNQSDYEKLVGLPVAPFMDREKVTKSASQCGFISFVILPLFESLVKLLPMLKDVIVQPAYDQLAYYSEAQHQNNHSQDDLLSKTIDEDDSQNHSEAINSSHQGILENESPMNRLDSINSVDT